MKLGFDIDDTLINLREYAFILYQEKLNKTVSIDDFRALPRLDINELFGLTDEQGKEIWKSLQEDIFFTSCPTFPNAIETLQKLEQYGHEIYYITARPRDLGERTKEWVKEKGFPVQDHRFFYGMQDHEKIEIIKQLDLDYYFDDKPKVLNTLLNESINVYVKDQSYNRHIELPRIVHWDELEHIISS